MENKLILNDVRQEDCLTFMQTLPDSCIDLVVTSPPYAQQRKDTYGGISESDYPQWMQKIGQEIYRILKPTGSFVLNIKEHVNAGKRSTYVLETVLELSKIFCWNDTFIWNKTNPFPTGNPKRLKDGFEYCYLFTKTTDYQFFPNNVLIPSTSKNLEQEKKQNNKLRNPETNGSGMSMSKRYSSDFVRPSNVISFPVDSTNHQHPATFPIDLPEFFIKLLSKEEDIVYDPFAGSGTTLVVAKNLNRNYIGTEIVTEYVNIIKNRLIDEEQSIFE